MYWIVTRYAAIFAVCFGIGWTVNGWRLNASINAIKASIAESRAKLEAEYRDKEKRLVEASVALRREKDNEIKRITNRLNAVIDELRDRPSRLPDSSRTCAGATGAELSKEDAEFLARIAAEADAAVAELNQCIKQYHSVRGS